MSQIHNFDVLFLDGNKLNQEIISCKSVAKKYFKEEYKKYIESQKEDIYVETFLSEFSDAEETYINEKKQYHLHKGFEIYLHVLIKNMQNSTLDKGEIALFDISENDYVFYNSIINIDSQIEEYSEKLYTFSGLILSPRNNIPLPKLKCNFVSHYDIYKKEVLNGSIDASDVWRSPYINSKSAEFMAMNYQQLQEVVPYGYARVIYIKGQSGTGKSRLITEIENKACELSYKIIHIDFRNQKDIDSIRTFFFRWLDLPDPDKLTQIDIKDFEEAISFSTSNKKIVKTIFKFLYENDNKIHPQLYKNFNMMNNIIDPLLISFDNIQEMNTDAQTLLWYITSSIKEKNIPICLIFGLNTERYVNDNNYLVNYLDKIGGEKTEHFINQYTCDSLIDDDATSIMLQLLHLNEDSKNYIKILIQKIGTLPLNILFFSKKIAQQKNIFGQTNGERYIEKPDILMSLFEELILNDKTDFYKSSKYIYNNYSDYHELFELIVLFEGNMPLPLAIQCGFDEKTLKMLIDNLVLRYGSKKEIICFYNDQLLNYIQTKTIVLRNDFYVEIVKYYENNFWEDEKHIDILSKVYLKSLIKIEKIDKAQKYGTDLLQKYKYANMNKDVCDVCTQLSLIYTSSKNPAEYSMIQLDKADFLLERINMEEAESIYEEIKYIIETKSYCFEIGMIVHFYHRYINQKLHTGQYSKAIEALCELEKIENKSTDAYYIIYDRYCVAYFNLGDLNNALECINKVIISAKNNNNIKWLSIAYSDKAFSYYYNCGDRKNIIDAFKKAVELQKDSENNDISRKIEIKIQEALYLILEKNLSEAESAIQAAVTLGEDSAYNYLLIPAYNIQSYILCRKLRYKTAIIVMKKSLSLATIYCDQKALVSIYNNLGVIHYLNNERSKSSLLNISKQILEKHPEWINSNKRYMGLYNNLNIIENKSGNFINNNVPLKCQQLYFIYH